MCKDETGSCSLHMCMRCFGSAQNTVAESCRRNKQYIVGNNVIAHIWLVILYTVQAMVVEYWRPFLSWFWRELAIWTKWLLLIVGQKYNQFLLGHRPCTKASTTEAKAKSKSHKHKTYHLKWKQHGFLSVLHLGRVSVVTSHLHLSLSWYGTTYVLLNVLKS